MNCCVVPSAMLGLGGVTAIDTNVADVTVSVTGAELTAPSAAVTCALPVAALEARPCEPEALLIVTAALFEDHETSIVTF